MTSVLEPPSVVPLEAVPEPWAEWEAQLAAESVAPTVSTMYVAGELAEDPATWEPLGCVDTAEVAAAEEDAPPVQFQADGSVVLHAYGHHTFSMTTTGSITVTAPDGQVHEYRVISGKTEVTHLPATKPRVFAPRLGNATQVTSWLLRKAAALMESVGMYQGDLWPGAHVDDDQMLPSPKAYRPGDPLCAWGAVLVSAGHRRLDAHAPIESYLWDKHRVLAGIAPFNDAAGRTRAQVAAELRRRAELLEDMERAAA